MRRVIHDEGTPRLVHVLAYLEIENHVLLQSSYQDLRAEVKGGIKWHLRNDGAGAVFVNSKRKQQNFSVSIVF